MERLLKKGMLILGADSSPSLYLLPITLLALASMSCSDSQDTPNIPKGDGVSRSIDITQAEQEASAQSNRFAWDLLDVCMGAEKDNVVLSPVSANICLSMLANAAAGDSRAQILDVMGFAEAEMADVNSLNRKLAQQLCGLDDNVTLKIANSFWYTEDINPKTAFLTDLRDNYDIQSFTIKPSTFASDVNRWCSDKTNGLIPRILDDDACEDFAFLNAIYFKGFWNSKYKFNKGNTDKGKFTNVDGTKSNVDFMHKQESYPFISAERWSAMRIPFSGGGYNLTVILPNDGYSIDECMVSMKEIEPATARFGSSRLDVKLPKFKMKHDQDLIDVLKYMGINDIFAPNRADFSNMTDNDMYIDLARQSVSFEIDEEGAKAAAVTVIGGVVTSVGPEEIEYNPFYVDRPFIFMISERSTGAILFLGRINKF